MSALASKARLCVASTSRRRRISGTSLATIQTLSTIQRASHPCRSRISPPTTSARCISSSTSVQAKKPPLDSYQGKRIDMDSFPPERIRNLSIIAHIDHGKSTLADRLLQMTGTVPDTANPQFLDKLKVERERGITVKAQTVSIIHRHTDGEEYLINLIDTPGHVDFSYEVSRSIGACEGGLILVDCTQGIQAQTLSVFHVALEANLTLLAVINKVDLPHASPQETSEQIESTLGLLSEDHMLISAKSGLGVEEVLKQIIEGLPSPKKWEGDDGKLRGLVFDTYYDHYRGVVALVRLFSGKVRVGDRIRFLQADKKYEVLEIGVNNPEETPVELLKEGQVGYLVCSMKSSEDAHIGDTICHEKDLVEPLPGFKPMKAMVYAGVFPMDTMDFGRLEEAIERLTLNDRSVTVARETSAALSQGFRLGFLGTLHMDVFRQRLEDEYSSEVIITAPTVPYKVVYRNGDEKVVSNPTEFPDMDNFKAKIVAVEEPMVVSTIIVPNDYIGAMMDLCSKYRATQLEYKVLETTGRSMLKYSFPLSEIVTDFFSALKSASSGFASFDYEEAGYEASDMVKMNILLNGRPVDALAMIVHRSAAQGVGKEWVRKMKQVIPRQLYELSIQAAVGHKVVARESISAARKDVTAGLYGGHYERKLKHLNKQKEGKKRLKALAGNIHVPQSAFFDVLSSRSRSFSTSSARRQTGSGFDPSDYPPPVSGPYFLRPCPTPNGGSTVSLDLLQDFESGLPAFPPLPARRQAHRPLARHHISPIDRSQRLSSLHRLSTCPAETVSSDDLYATYADAYFSSSSSADMLTPTEIKETLVRLHKLDSDPDRNADRSVSKERLGELVGHFKHASEQQLGPRSQGLVQHILLTCDPLSKACPSEEEVDRAERRLLRMTRNNLLAKHRPSVAFFLSMMVKSHRETARFQSWWDRVDKEMTLNSELYLVRAAFLAFHGRLDNLTALVQQALDDDALDDHAKVILLNFLLGTHANYAHWDVVSGIYSTLHSPRPTLESAAPEPLPFPLNNPVQAVNIPKHIRASRSTYSSLISALCFAGYIEPALYTIRAMYQAEHYPFVDEYCSLFKAFALFGHAPPQDGPATILFPKIRFEEIGRRRADLFTNQWGPTAFSSSSLSFARIWQKGAWASGFGAGADLPPHIRRSIAAKMSEDGDRGGEDLTWSAAQNEDGQWTLDVAQQLFMSLLSVRPGTRGVVNSKAYLAPNPDQMWHVLMAFSRMSGGDRHVLSRAWMEMKRKFSGEMGEKWIGWRMNRRLSRVARALEATTGGD